MCARKVAAVSGDVRRALGICRCVTRPPLRASVRAKVQALRPRRRRRAAELCTEAGVASVSIEQIKRAAEEVNASVHLQVEAAPPAHPRAPRAPRASHPALRRARQAIALAPQYERIVLAAAVLQMRQSGLEEAAFDDVLPRVRTLAATEGLAGTLSTAEVCVAPACLRASD